MVKVRPFFFTLLLVAPSLRANPSWWQGTNPALCYEAEKASRPIILFFSSLSEESLRMENEVLHGLSEEQTSSYLWKHLDISEPEGRKLAQFHWVAKSPTILVRDSLGTELARVEGLMDAKSLMEAIEGARSPDAARGAEPVTFGDGKIFSKGKTQGANPAIKPWEHAYSMHLNFEKAVGLDAYHSVILEEIKPDEDSLVLAPGEGPNGSVALAMTSQPGSPVGVLLDVSESFAESQLEAGYFELSMLLTVMDATGKRRPARNFELVINRLDEPQPSLSAIRSNSARSKRTHAGGIVDNFWHVTKIRRDVEIPFRQCRAYLAIWLADAGDRLLVDEIKGRIMPPNQEWIPDPLQEAPEGYRASPYFRKIDRNCDMKISRDEIPERRKKLIEIVEKRTFDQWFDGMDENGDGKLQPSEFQGGEDDHRGVCGNAISENPDF